jgi:cytochrome c oxidase subunit 2
MPARPLILALTLFAIAFTLAACGDAEEEGPGTGPSSSGAVEPPRTVEAEIEVGDFYFKPAIIEAAFGDKIAVDLLNEGVADHTFTISEFFVDQELTDGKDGDVTFTPNEPGEFTFFCSKHPDQMQGALRITRPGDTSSGSESPTPDPGGGGGGY